MVQLLLRCSSARVATRRIYPATLKNQLSRASITPLTATPYRSRRVFSATSVLDRRVDILVPQLAESISEATLASLHKQLGEHVKTDEEVATLETDKIDVSANAPEDGRIVEVHVAENDTVTVGQKIATMDTDDGAGEPQKIEAESKESQSEALSTSPNAPQELPVEPSPEPKPEPSPSPASAPEAPAEVPVRPSDMAVPGPRVEEMPPSTQPTYRQERVERMPRIRQTIARRLKESQNRTASLTTVQRIDMSSLMQWRSQYKEHVMKEHGVRLGYMGAFTKAATMAALEIPQINASIDMDKEIITYRDYVDISIAVSTPKGLVTPVLRNTESMNVIDIERGVAALAGKVGYRLSPGGAIILTGT